MSSLELLPPLPPSLYTKLICYFLTIILTIVWLFDYPACFDNVVEILIQQVLTSCFIIQPVLFFDSHEYCFQENLHRIFNELWIKIILSDLGFSALLVFTLQEQSWKIKNYWEMITSIWKMNIESFAFCIFTVLQLFDCGSLTPRNKSKNEYAVSIFFF